MAIIFGNNAISTLTVSLFAIDTVVIIDAADMNAFPSPTGGDYFLITIEDLKPVPPIREICKCTGRAGNLLTIVRAFEGFPANDFAVGTTTVSNRVTAHTMDMAINVWPPADSKVYGTKITTVGGPPTFVEVLTTQGALTFGGPISVGITAPAGTPAATLYTSDVSINGAIGFNEVWNSTGTPGWHYRNAGFAALWAYDPAVGQLSAYMSPTGAAGAAVASTVAALRINAKGQLAGGNVGLPAADDTRYTWTADNFALEPGGYFAFNTYLGAGATWRTKVAGYSGLMYLDSGAGNLQFFANPSVGAAGATPLTLGMQLSSTGTLQVMNTVFATKGVSFSSFNSWEYMAYTTAGGDHIFSHRSGWYDVWYSSGGTRTWVAANVGIMTLDGGGNLTAIGVIRSNSQLWASSDNSHGLFTSGGRWKVHQFSADGWRLQWDGQNGQLAFCNNSSAVLWSVDGSGNVWANGNYTTGTDISARSIYASGTMQAGYIHSTGNMQTDVDNNVSRNVNCAGTVTAGVIHSTGMMYTDQNLQAAGNVLCGAIFCPNGSYTGGNNDTSFGNYRGSGQYIMQFAANWYWGWETANGTCIWHNNGANFWVMNTADNTCINYRGAVGGYGGYLNFSDRRFKEAPVPTARGLAEIIQLQPMDFTRVPVAARNVPKEGDIILPPVPSYDEIGFIAQDVAIHIPEAIRAVDPVIAEGAGLGTFAEGDPPLGMSYDILVAVMVNAIKELNTRLVALEGAP